MAKKATPSTSLRSSIDSFRNKDLTRERALYAARQKEVGNRLRKLREDRGLYLYEVATQLNPPVWPQTLHKWEGGERKLPFDRLHQLAAIYGVKVEEVLGG